MTLYVQSAYGDVGGSSLSNWQPWSTTQPLIGHGLIFVFTLQQSVGGTGVTLALSDNQAGNSYSVIAQSPPDSGTNPGTQIAYAICSALASVSGTYKISVAPTNGNIYGISVIEVNTAIALDKSSLPAQITTGATSETVTCASANANADEIVVAALAAHYEASAIGLSDPTTGYTRLGLQDPSAGCSYALAYKETAAVETSSSAWSWTTSANFVAGLATFKSTGGGGGPPKSQFFFGAKLLPLAPLAWIIGRRNRLA